MRGAEILVLSTHASRDRADLVQPGDLDGPGPHPRRRAARGRAAGLSWSSAGTGRPRSTVARRPGVGGVRLQERSPQSLHRVGPYARRWGMTHTVREKQKLLARVKRLRGQVEAIERALENEAGCEQVMHLIAGVRGATAGLMAEVVEDHVRTHLVDADKHPGALNTRSRGAIDGRRPHLPEIGGRPWPTLRRHCSRPGTATSSSASTTEAPRRRTWAVIWLCGAMMVAEIVGGLLFGSIALVADGLHMARMPARCCWPPWPIALRARMPMMLGSRSAPASSATWRIHQRDHSGDDRAADRLRGDQPPVRPGADPFAEAIPIACLGLAVNVVSAWLLSSGGHDHGFGHGLGHDHGHDARAPDRCAPAARCC